MVFKEHGEREDAEERWEMLKFRKFFALSAFSAVKVFTIRLITKGEYA